jgi:hypothetical protein
MACQKIATFPLRAISIMCNKTLIEKGVFTEKNQLYHYVTRHLIERLSWLCRDMRPQAQEGDGRVKIIFSRKKGMDYPHFQNYLRTLKEKQDKNIKIHWPVIDIDAVEAQDHSRKAGLQIADCIATAFREAVDPNRYGNTEVRYARDLKTIAYQRQGNFMSYGVKIIPSVDRMILTKENKEFFELYSK